MGARNDALQQALQQWRRVCPPTSEDWRDECGRVAAALVTGLGRLHRQRAVALVLHTVANWVLGSQGNRALFWAQQARAVPGLLREARVLPWLQWLCQLPLPALRECHWVDLLVDALPEWLDPVWEGAADVHDVLHRHLQLPSDPLRMVLLGAAALLWFHRQGQQPIVRPTTVSGQRAAQLPYVLDTLDLTGSAARRLFSAPHRATAMLPPDTPRAGMPTTTSATDTTRLLSPVLPAALATAATMAPLAPRDWQRRATPLVAGVAAAVAGAGLIGWRLHVAYAAYAAAVQQMGERIEDALYGAPATREARELGEALWVRMAALAPWSTRDARETPADTAGLASQAHVVLALAVEQHALTYRQALRAVCRLDDGVDDALLDAATGWALQRVPRSVPRLDPDMSMPPSAEPDVAAAQDLANLIEAAWMLRDAASAGTPALPGQHTFQPTDGSPFARALQAVRQQLIALYRNDEFLDRLYAERTPPSSLAVANGTLTGKRATSGTVVVLHPQPDTPDNAAWSARTGALLGGLQRAVLDAGTCFDNALPARLDCALGFYIEQAAPASAQSSAMLDVVIHRLERALQHAQGGTAAANDTATLVRLHARVQYLKSVPIRGLPPDWGNWRPDPRSHLGHNMALARDLLLQLSQHPELLSLCWHRHADPAQLSYPAVGPVRARALDGSGSVTLFDAAQPPAALRAIGTMLRGLAAVLHAPARSDGRLGVPEMLAYYESPLPPIPMDDAQFDACLDGLELQMARHRRPAGERGGIWVEWDERSNSTAQQDHQQLLDVLWNRIDALPVTLDQALAHQHVVPVSSSPLHEAWRDAQDLLRQVFEQPAVWLEMRRTNASFHALRVGTDGLTARLRSTGQSVAVVDAFSAQPAPLSALLEALHRTIDRLGRFSPGDAVPLTNALQFHGAYLRPAPAACEVPAACTRGALLQAIAHVSERWQRHAPNPPSWRQASNELQDLAGVLMQYPDAATRLHRPALGTTSMAIVPPALRAFARLLADARVQAALAREGVMPHTMSVNATGVVLLQGATGSPRPLVVPPAVLNGTSAAPSLGVLRNIARQLGGQVRSDGRIALFQQLAAHGGCAPQDTAAVNGTARCVERLLGEVRLGMRADLLHAADLLDTADLERLHQATTDFKTQHVPGDQSLLEYLGTPLVEGGGPSWDELQRSTHLLACIARTPRALALQTALLQALGWYRGSRTAPTSPTLLASLTRHAIVLDLGPRSNRDARVLLGYRLHKPSNWGRTHAQIRTDFQDYLRSMGHLPDALLGMATTLALQDLAPELLVVDVPDNLVYANTIASITFISGVHLAERIQRGLSQQMRFAELLTLSADLTQDADTPDTVKQLALDARRLPTLDWYVFRQLEHQPGLPARPAAAQRIEVALNAFDQRVADIEQAIDDVLAPLPYRMQLVEAEIRRVFPTFPGILANHPWNSTRFRLFEDDASLGRCFPFHELVAAGVLRDASAPWRPCRSFVPRTPIRQAQGDPAYDVAVHRAYAQIKPQLDRLPNITLQYQQRFDAYFRAAQRGYGLIIEEALYQRPEAERAALLRGDVEVFTLRTHEPELEAQQETRNDTDPYRGRFGIVYTLKIDGQYRHFQLFPLQSRIIPLALEGPLPLGGVLQKRSVRLRSGNVATIQVRRGTSLPVDWNAYVSDQAPAEGISSLVIVERLPAPPTPTDDGTRVRSPFHALVEPVQREFFWLDAAAFRREGWAPTSYESYLEEKPLWLKTVDFIVPFVENLRSLSSKNRNEFGMAAFGLYLESIIVVGPIIGGVVKVLARPGLRMTMPRAAELSRVLARGTVDAINPAAGSLTLLRLGVCVVQRGARGNLRFLWPITGPDPTTASAIGARWVMREGMAIAKKGHTLASSLYDVRLRTVDGIPNTLVAPLPGGDDSRALHLIDPATLSLYGAPLEERIGSSGGAAGMLFKAGSNVRAPHVSPGKAVKPIKQGPKASEEDADDAHIPLQPPDLSLATREGRTPPAVRR
ncbi:hypothetical protein [Stenotrophomonas sp. PD6]|uniref:hypothetical protein n=1 Tax=Stenotrophomonas sp. PD6 TaxID=3368612 RepID=UPI003B9EFA3B